MNLLIVNYRGEVFGRLSNSFDAFCSANIFKEVSDIYFFIFHKNN